MAGTIPGLVAGVLGAVFLTAGLSKIFAAKDFKLPFGPLFAKESVATGFVIGGVEALLALGLVLHIQVVSWIVLVLFGFFVGLALLEREARCNCTARESTDSRWRRVGLRLIGTGAAAFLLLEPPSTSLPTIVGLVGTVALLVCRGHLLGPNRLRALARRSISHADEYATVGDEVSRRALLRQGASVSVGVAALLAGSPLSAMGRVPQGPCQSCPPNTECWCSSTGQCYCSPVDPGSIIDDPPCPPPSTLPCRTDCLFECEAVNYQCPLKCATDCPPDPPEQYYLCVQVCEELCARDSLDCVQFCTNQFNLCVDAVIAEYRECIRTSA